MGNPFEDAISGGQEYISQLKQAMQPQSGLAGLDPVWLAAAQGFLSPTKTGGFGEGVANAAGAVQAPLKAIKDQQMSAADKIRATQEASARLWLQQQNMNKADAGAEDLKAAQAEYYRAHTANLADKVDLQSLHNLQQNYKDQLNALKITTVELGELSPDELAARKKQIADVRKKNDAVTALIEKKMGIGAQDEDQPPVEGARKGTDPNTGEKGWFIEQNGKYIRVYR